MSKFEQVTLNYAMDAFEPVIDTLTMETHYGKHHATYTATFNKLLEEAGVADKFNTIEEVLAGLDKIDELFDGLTTVNSACVRKGIYEAVKDRTDKHLIPIDLYLTYEWVD